MTVSREHERPKGLLARLVAALTEELGLEIETGGNMTFRLEAEQRGMEADEVFWIQHQPQVRGRDSFDPETDPPPDLALEIEITNPIGRRLEIYAALRIPEIWRCDGQVVVIHLLGPDQQYAEAERSRAFPLVAAADLTRFVGLRGTMGMNAIIQEFRTWIRAQGAARP